MESMEMEKWSEFNRKFWSFGMAALAFNKAKFVIENNRSYSFTQAQKDNIIREYHMAYRNMESAFEELMEIGIPPHMLPIQLVSL